MSKKEVIPEQSKALTLPELDMEGEANLGFDGITAKDMAMPFIVILQALSPQIKKGMQKVDGAEEGDILNSVTQQLTKAEQGITVVPCAFQKRWVEWKPRDSGGGFVVQDADDSRVQSCHKDDKGKLILPNGNNLIETAYHYVLVVNEDGSYYRGVLSMTSSQLKKSRRWNTTMISLQRIGKNGRPYTPPTFGYSYKLTTIQEQKAGNSWYSWSVSAPTALTDADLDLFNAAKKFSQDVGGGVVKVDKPAEAPHIEPTDVGI